MIMRRMDDLLLINQLINKSYIVIVVPGKGVAVAWLKRDESFDRRVVKKMRLRNGIEVVWVKLTL